MKIVSWNCHYGLNEEKTNIILDLFSEADIFILQECKRTDIDIFKDNWKYKNWYGDDQDIKSNLGIAIFSKNHKVEFTEIFNRKYRYVVPYKVILNDEPTKSFILFAIWTKSNASGNYYYDQNVINAIHSTEYKDLLNGDIVIIGDFNTGATSDDQKHYINLCNQLKNYKNCALKNSEVSKETFYSSSEKKLYINDFCFVSEKLYSSLNEFVIHDDWELNNNGKKSWNGSDHCPICVEFDFN